MHPTTTKLRLRAVAICGAALLLFPVQAFAQFILQEAHPLKVGQFQWDESSPPEGALSITISIAQQRLYVYRGGRLIGVSTASTGKPGHSTPLGDFTVLQKDLWHRSNIYSNAPMPYMQRLTWSGIAIHAGHLPGYPASHGCIRLPAAFAKRLFAITALGVPVTILGRVNQPAIVLKFADIEWLLNDDEVSAPAPAPTVARTVPPAPATEAGNDDRPHWASWQEIEAARKAELKVEKRAKVRLDYDTGVLAE